MRAIASLLTAATAIALLGAGCPRSHDELAASGGAGPTGAGGAAATSTESTASSSSDATTSSSSTASSGGSGGGGGDDAGPLPPSKLTILDGVNDYPAVRLCFVPYPEGDDVAPWPADPAGLPFARAAVVDPATVVPEGTDVRVDVVAGDLAQTAGKSCAEIRALAAGDGGASPVVVASLPILPGASFASHKSLLLAPIGCLGGAGHTGPGEQLGCGSGYSAATPTPGLVALGMKTLVAPGKVALQIVHASAAMPVEDVRLTPGYDGAPDFQVAGSLAPGEIAPPTPWSQLALMDIAPLASAKLKTFAPNDMYATSVTTLSSVALEGNVPLDQIQDGGGYVLVALGGYPGVAGGSFWHPFTYALLRADP